MNLESQLANELVRRYPARAASVLDRMPQQGAAGVLADASAAAAAAVVARMSPHPALDVFEQLDVGAAAAILGELEQDVASRLARRLAEDRREAVFAALPARIRHRLRTLLNFSENTAGALMDPEVLALAGDLTCEQAMARVRAVPDQARYNLYVVNREQELIGVVNLRELLLAPANETLSDVMVRDPVRLQADADRSIVISHPGWKRVHSIPVVDDRGVYLGAVRYRALRRLEEELVGAAVKDANTSEALGEVFASGASGLLDALTGAGAQRRVE